MNDFESLDLGSTPSTGTKKCSKCGTLHSRKGSYYCKDCHNEHQKEWNKKNPYSQRKWIIQRRADIRKLIEKAKAVPCADCGIEYPSCVMDFDHQKDKEFLLSVAANKNMAIKRVLDEIAKCEVVCANCHRIRTFKNR